MFCLYFAPGPVRSWDDAARSDPKAFAAFFHALVRRGMSVAPSPYEAGFLSTAHTERDVDAFAEAVRDSLAEAASAA
jgi:glutamate-1-semialdehyde 2,1-aminomutase